MEKKQFITDNEVAILTGLSLQTLRNWRHQKKGFPYVKVGRSVRYAIIDVEAYMENNKINLHAAGSIKTEDERHAR
jgi:excisionase family DNA binding protein